MVPGSANRTNDHVDLLPCFPGVNKHVFPKDPKKLEMWLRAIPRENWTPTPHSIICSLHFDESDYKTERTVRARASGKPNNP